MNHIIAIISGIGSLIVLYLILSNASSTIKIISTISENAINGIQVLQGRDKLITDND